MSELSVRSSLTITLAVILLAAGLLAGLDRYGKQCRVTGRAGSITSAAIDRCMVDDPREVYLRWKRSGYRGRKLVYVSARWESFNPDDLTPPPMARPFPLELFNTARLLEENNLDGVTFLYIASLNKIAREIEAILPDQELDRMKSVARAAKNSRLSERGVYVSRQGFPRWFLSADQVRSAGEPVLLYIGASYFRDMDPETLYRQLTRSGLTTDSVILCREVGTVSVTPAELARIDRFARLIGLPNAPSGLPSSLPAVQSQGLPAS